MKIPSDIDVDAEALAAFCHRHRVRRLALFGSALRDDFGPHSDVDVLVEFDPGATPGLFDRRHGTGTVSAVRWA